MAAKFKITKAGTPVIAWWPCKIHEPVDSPDGARKHEEKVLTCQFELLDQGAISEEAGKSGITGLLKRVVKAWDLTDEDGPVAMERLGDLLLIPYVKTGIYAGYIDFITGMPEKN